METLRRARWITRLVMIGFALFIGAAVASPLFKPATGQMVCSAMGGMKLVLDDDGLSAAPLTSLDCPLCAPVLLLPVPAGVPSALPDVPGQIAGALPVPHRVEHARAPLPPRGPPALG